MSDYIKREDAVFAACKVLHNIGACHLGVFCPDFGCRVVRDVFDEIPAADVVERKRGKWIYDSEAYPLGNPYGHYVCDQCGESVPHKTKFCPECGCRMDAE